MVGFTTGLPGWVGSPWFLDISIVRIVFVGFVGNLFIGLRYCLTTVVACVDASTIRDVFGLGLSLV